MRSAISVAVTWAAVLAVLAAVGGWGAFFFVSERAVATEEAQRRELRELRFAKAEAEKALSQQQARATELVELERKLQGTRDAIERTREAQEKAQGTLVAVQNEVASRRAELSNVAQQLAQSREQQARAEQKAAARAEQKAAAEETASIDKPTRKKRLARKSKRGKKYARAG
jgi:hypothetical protein